MKNVLIYYPPNRRSIAIETLCRSIHEAGHKVLFLTLAEKGPIHEELEKSGIATFSFCLQRKSAGRYFYRHSRYLVRFCKRNKIDIVLSHLQEGNVISIMAQPFLKAKFFLFRHHAESQFYARHAEKFGMKRNRKEIFLDKMINRLGKKIVVPSSDVWISMEKYEGCNMKKVLLLPYIYDFNSYQKPDTATVQSLREKYPCQLMLIMVSRMIASKRHQVVFEIVNKLVKEGLSVKMIVMDDGPLRPELEKFIAGNNLQDHIILTGYRDDFVNYMDASDLLIHPSVTEASNNVVKELALMEKAVAVCREVGDFSDYIKDDINGFFLETNELEKTIEAVIRDAYNDPAKLERFGAALKKEVLYRFSDSPQNRKRFLDLLN